jgi:hypothetical protein
MPSAFNLQHHDDFSQAALGLELNFSKQNPMLTEMNNQQIFSWNIS